MADLGTLVESIILAILLFGIGTVIYLVTRSRLPKDPSEGSEGL